MKESIMKKLNDESTEKILSELNEVELGAVEKIENIYTSLTKEDLISGYEEIRNFSGRKELPDGIIKNTQKKINEIIGGEAITTQDIVQDFIIMITEDWYSNHKEK